MSFWRSFTDHLGRYAAWAVVVLVFGGGVYLSVAYKTDQAKTKIASKVQAVRDHVSDKIEDTRDQAHDVANALSKKVRKFLHKETSQD